MNKNIAIPLTDIGLEKYRYLMRDTKAIIYKITNTVNGKVYIGQTSNSFIRRYGSNFTKTKNTHLNNSILKYGLDKFTVEIVYCNLDLDTLNFYEYELVYYYDACNPCKGYNKKEGGDSGKPSEETKLILGLQSKKKVKVIYKGKTIIKDSINELSDYMYTKYNIPNVKGWFSEGVPYKYIKDFEIIGYLAEDGSVVDLKKNELRSIANKKQVKAIYKGSIILKDSRKEFVEYMKNTYNLKDVRSWFTKGLPYEHINDFESIGYLKEDGSIEELKRNKRTGSSNKKPIKAIYKGEVIVKDSIGMFNEYMMRKYKFKSVTNWFTNGVPYDYIRDFESIGYLQKDGSVKELKRCKMKCNPMQIKVKAIYKGKVIVKDSIEELSSFLFDYYCIKGVRGWFNRGMLPYAYIKDFESIGYLQKDGTIKELKRCYQSSNKRVRAIYRGEVIVKDSIKEFSVYMANNYGLKQRGVCVWFQTGLPFKYINDFESIGYLNEDGTVEELKRKKLKV